MFTAVAVGMGLTPSPAMATPLASVSVIVERPPVNGLLRLCITSQSLDPNGTCIELPPSAGGLPSGGTAGAITSTGEGTIHFYYSGLITLGGQTFHGNASGIALFLSTSAVPPFQLTGTSSSDTLSATCSGHWYGIPGAFIPPGGGAVSVLTCTGSVNGGASGTTTLVSAYTLTSSSVRPGDAEAAYSGTFSGI
jgi:hypothetical protein